MKKFALVATLAIVSSMTASSAYAASNTSSASASASSAIIQPITIAKDTDLSFGRIVKPSTGTGTVTIGTGSDAVTAASGAVALTGVTTSRAGFTINGEGAQAISISMPSAMEMKNGDNTISVNLSKNLENTSTLSGSAGSQGTLDLRVGGAFDLPSTTASGAYTGSFEVSVSYQ